MCNQLLCGFSQLALILSLKRIIISSDIPQPCVDNNLIEWVSGLLLM